MVRIILAVTNDLVTDNRLHKVATALMQQGYSVTIVGRKLNASLPLGDCAYRTHRFRLLFNRSALFYANYNFRLFFYLLKTPVDIITANDADTLLACWLAAKLRRKVLVFDSHELFSEVPELVGRPLVRAVWRTIENLLIPRVQFAYTVSGSIQQHYRKKYNQVFELVRNAGNYRKVVSKKEHNNTPLIIYQGYVNKGRGLDLMLGALPFLGNVKLCVAGNGDLLNEMKALAKTLEVEDKVEFLGRVPLTKLAELTANANVGISLEEDLGLNYRYALPNKLFDYIQSRIPVIVSDLPEMSALVESYQLGLVLKKRTPEELAKLISEIISNRELRSTYIENLEAAASELCWENEKFKLISIYAGACAKLKARIS